MATEKDDDGTRALVRELQNSLEHAYHHNSQLMDANVRAVDQQGPLVERLLVHIRRFTRLEVALRAIAEGHIEPDAVQRHARAALDD